MNKVIIYCDGSSNGKVGDGGYGAVVMNEKKILKISGYNANATNNTEELRATIFALRALKHSCEVEAFLDSQYVINGFAKGWVKNWKRNGWKSSTGDPVKNKELWIELDVEVAKHKVTWRWVKGHSGDHYNEMVDKLAKDAKNTKKGVRIYEDLPYKQEG